MSTHRLPILRSKSPSHRQSSIVGFEAVGCIEVVDPLSKHRELSFGVCREPYESGTEAEALSLEVAESRTAPTVTSDLIIVVTAYAEGEGLGQELVCREIEVKLGPGSIIRFIVSSVYEDTGRKRDFGSLTRALPVY
jgi:hypothetical protein